MKVLAIGAHPDDLELNCYGTLAKYVKLGHEVYICGVSNGDLGHYRIMPEELAKIRVKEAAAAAKVIGAKEYVNLGGHDTMISRYDKKLEHKLIDYIRKVCPDLIITQYPDDYMSDHIETSALAFNASFNATLPHLATEGNSMPEKVPSLMPIYYFAPCSKMAFMPTDFVDITEEVDLKLKAMMCHKSQLEWLGEHDGVDALAGMNAQSAAYGKLLGVPYAEAFMPCRHDSRMTTKRVLP